MAIFALSADCLCCILLAYHRAKGTVAFADRATSWIR